MEIEQQGFGYVVAYIGELGGVVPYTSYNARVSYIKNNPDVIDGFSNAIQRGLDFVYSNDSETIAKSILSFFPDTSLNDLTRVVERYKVNEAWAKSTNMTEESFMHLQEIMIAAGELKEAVKYKDMVHTR